MFSNIGKKIKDFAQIMFVVEVIGSLISAGIIGFKNVGGAVGFLVFLLLGVLFFGGAYLSVIFIYGFGDLVDNAERIRENIESVRWNDRVEANTEPERKYGAPAAYNLSGKPIFKDHESANQNTAGGWTCMRCGAQNKNNSSTCTNCGMQRT